jgi:hypothetical protein
MSRRIVFAGGIQTRALARIYRSEIASESGDDVVFIGSGALGTEAARAALLLANVVASEVDEDGDAVSPGDLPTQAELVRIPNLYADFLWPYAGRSHPKNRGQFALPGGPYPAEHGDRFLDQQIADGVDPDEAVRRYLALDVVRDGELDSRLEDRLALLRRLDGVAGFDLAGYIADNFRTSQLFRTRQRMTQKLVRRVMRQLLPKLGVRGFNVERIQRVPFPAGAQPVHPGVAAHFKLKWAGPGTRYPVNEEGYFTFEEFCVRYMQFAWNEVLHRGIQAAKTLPASALADLDDGLALSPDSPLGRRALAVARHAAGLEPVAPADTMLDEDSYDPADEPTLATKAAAAAQAAPETEVAAAPDAAPEMPPAPADDTVTEAPSPKAGETRAVAEDDAHDAMQARFAPPETPAEPPRQTPSYTMTEDGFTDFGKPTGAGAKARDPEPARAPQPASSFGTTHDGFTDFGKPGVVDEPEELEPEPGGTDLIDVLPRMLPAFSDLSGAAERPFAAMPEIMPPPPLRPILPPELQGDGEKKGLFSRILGRKQ